MSRIWISSFGSPSQVLANIITCQPVRNKYSSVRQSHSMIFSSLKTPTFSVGNISLLLGGRAIVSLVKVNDQTVATMLKSKQLSRRPLSDNRLIERSHEYLSPSESVLLPRKLVKQKQPFVEN
jgi:hypothetical protein